MNAKDGAKEFAISRLSAWYILIVCTLLYMINYMDRQVLSITIEFIKKDLSLSDTQIGVIQTLFFTSMAVFSIQDAYMVDRWSRRKTVCFMAVCWSFFTFMTGLGKNFLGLLIPRTLVGVGEAGFTSGGTPLIAAAFPKRSRSMAMGIFNMAIPLGSALGAILGGAISQSYGWRMSFFVFTFPGIILGLLAFYMKDYKTVRDIDETGHQITFPRSAISLFSIPTLKWLYLGFAMQTFMAFAYLTWLPSFIMRMQGLDAKKAGLVFGIIALMSIFGAVFGGITADLWQKKNKKGRMLTAATALLIASVFFFLMIYFNVSGIGFAFGIIFGIFSVVPMPAISAVTQDVSPPSLKGVSWGMAAFCCYVLGGAWAPMFVGAISDGLGGGAHGIKIGLLITTFGGIAGALFYWLSAQHYPNDMKNGEKHIVEAD
jgi:MFS family permease